MLFLQLIAQNVRNPALGGLGGLNGPAFFGKLIPALIGLGIVIGAIVFVAYLIYGAIQWIGSGGDKMKMEQARSKITSALVGLVILLGFFAILNLVSCFFGIGITQFSVGPFNVTFTGVICPASGGGGGGVPTGGNPACPCGAGCSGYYAVTGRVGSQGAQCYRCTNSGWTPVAGSCGVLHCSSGGGWDCRNP